MKIRASRKMAGFVVLSLLLTVSLALGAGGQAVTVEVPLDTVVYGPEGSSHLLGSADVPQELQGLECEVAAIAQNQESVHPNNDLIVSSNDDQIVLADVEREAGVHTVADELLTLGSEITVTLVLGSDGVFSAGIMVKLCDIPELTTTTTTTTIASSTTTPPTTSPSTTVPLESTTTVMVAPSTTSTTVGPESTTTVTVAPTTTRADTTTTTTGVGAETTTLSTLAFTGVDAEASVRVAVAALVAGLILVILSAPGTGRGRHAANRR